MLDGKKIMAEARKRVEDFEKMPVAERPANYAREYRFARMALSASQSLFGKDANGRPIEEDNE